MQNYVAYKERLEEIGHEDPEIFSKELVRKVFLSKYDTSESEREAVNLAWSRSIGETF